LGVPATKIVAYGESLGSGQAVRLGAARPVAAVVLEAPLTSTIDVARSTYFWLPLGLLIRDKYNNERNIRLVKAPVLVLHGAQDAVIPVEMGWRGSRRAGRSDPGGSGLASLRRSAGAKAYSTLSPGPTSRFVRPGPVGEDTSLC